MSTSPSEVMMDLLKELALLKQLDGQHEQITESNLDLPGREGRRREIADQIKALADQSTSRETNE